MDSETFIFSSLTEEEALLLKDFKHEIFYYVGDKLENYNFWQQFFNLFFLYHYDNGNNETPAKRLGLEPAKIVLFYPSLFSRLKGENYFTEEKLSFDENEENSMTWFKEREMILGVFTIHDNFLSLVEGRNSLVIQMNDMAFFKKLKKEFKEKSLYSHTYLMFLLSLLLLKKERFAASKLYNPFTTEELEKTHHQYEKFASKFI